MWQANFVRDALLAVHLDIDVELVEIVSEGDRTLDVPLASVGGKGLFLKELEQGLVSGDIDIAVHSMKDVTVSLPDGLHIPVMCQREDPRDVLVSNNHASLGDMPPGATVGTCSLRRQCQVASAYPHLVLKNLRGNVNTRLARLDEGEYDGIILAAAGLIRLKMESRIAQRIDTDVSLPAVGQGVIGIECRIEDEAVNRMIAPLNDPVSSVEVAAERATNERLGGGCHVPVALHCAASDGKLDMRGLVGLPDGSRILRSRKTGTTSDPEGLGYAVGDDLLSRGAGEILESVYGSGRA